MMQILIVSMEHGKIFVKLPLIPRENEGVGYYYNGYYYIGNIFSIVYQFDENNNFKYVEITVEQ